MRQSKSILLLFAGAILCGCNKQTSTTSSLELIARNASTYMVNKDTGDVFLISGNEYTRLKESISHTNAPASEWSRIIAISSGTNSANVKVNFKHKWRNGVMDYIFTAAPQQDFFSQELAAGNNAFFELRFYDADGFQKRLLYINVSKADFAYDNGKLVALQNSSVLCSEEDHQDYQLLGVTWQGFVPPPPYVPLLPEQTGNEAWKNDAVQRAFYGTPTATAKNTSDQSDQQWVDEVLKRALSGNAPNKTDDISKKLTKIQDELAEIKTKLGIEQ